MSDETTTSGADESDLPPVREGFRIDTYDAAAWVVGTIAEAEAILEQRKAAAKAYVAEAQRRVNALHARFDAELECWAKENRPVGKQTITFVGGHIKFQTRAAHYEVVAQDEVEAWARKEVPAAFRPREDFLVSELTAWLKLHAVVRDGKVYHTETGEEIQGIMWKDADKDAGFKVGT